MADMLVKLYELPPLEPALASCRGAGVDIRRGRAPEKPILLEWVRTHFEFWVSEVEVCFSRSPVSCHIALHERKLLGFACYDAFAPNFFGPTGVAESDRHKGVGTALLLAALYSQRAQGYAYAIIGGVGPAAFYEKRVGATLIPDSDPGPYADLLT